MASSSRYGDAKVSPGFIARKSKILSDLAVPDGEYTDLSPKGSVDEGIRDLIKEINALDGLVTTSSCAGRVSVFVEGHKSTNENRKTANAIAEDEEHVAFAVEQDAEHIDNRDLDDEEGEEGDVEGERRKRFVPSGGKGSGRWLYVSHDPIDIINIINGHETPSLHELFGLIPGDGIPKAISGDARVQLIRFHYDPMILHIMTATLYHAKPVLSAASHAGFRESGLQSLRCLDYSQRSDPQQQLFSLIDASSHSPIVAVRSSGLSLESVIGYCEYRDEKSQPVMRSLVTEEYLRMLVALANDRFDVNKERVARFRSKLLDLYEKDLAADPNTSRKKKPVDWEDPQARKERKRAEGLKKQAEKMKTKNPGSQSEDIDLDMGLEY